MFRRDFFGVLVAYVSGFFVGKKRLTLDRDRPLTSHGTYSRGCTGVSNAGPRTVVTDVTLPTNGRLAIALENPNTVDLLFRRLNSEDTVA